MSGISPATMAKLTKGENVTTDILIRICKALNCDISDIMEIVPDNDNIGEKR
jgi:DNA-binding Xre family transcriptional regulator